ncbi:hypothetical protein NIB75_04505 [Bacteroides uniformis]|nr:hypothetical protein [Bacteroides uniformis]
MDEKINLLSTDLGVPRFNIPRCGHYEGLHGLTLGGPAMWGGRQRTKDGKVVPTDCPTTIFPPILRSGLHMGHRFGAESSGTSR